MPDNFQGRGDAQSLKGHPPICCWEVSSSVGFNQAISRQIRRCPKRVLLISKASERVNMIKQLISKGVTGLEADLDLWEKYVWDRWADLDALDVDVLDFGKELVVSPASNDLKS